MKNFALIGVGGYIAPRHLEAISELGHRLVAAVDPNDSVGILDRYFPECQFFNDLEKFKSYTLDQKACGKNLDFVSICSPNYLHFSHIKTALELGADCICEKPLVLTENELRELKAIERSTGKKVYTVLQLRTHEAILNLRKAASQDLGQHHIIDLTYMTSRGPWYHQSWKGNVDKSGGLSTNIGIHFFDMLVWIFGPMKSLKLEEKTSTEEKGTLELERASVRWRLTINRNELPPNILKSGKATFRSIKIDGKEFEFSEGFNELHKKVYAEILNGRGYGLDEALPAIQIVEMVREMQL